MSGFANGQVYSAAHTVPREELRFAVVLNGGVSLAVWMGGAVLELQRLTEGRDVYGKVMGLLNVQARADVISGTSAGGINGAALALGQVNARADLSVLRDLWAEQGRMDTLLQRPFQGAPASLLRGDDYFLPKLGEAMRRLSKPYEQRMADGGPIPVELTITTTLLNGARSVSVDSMGQRLPQRRHDGKFVFRRGESPSGEDQFDPSSDEDVAAKLALAARCSAGFPIAFEPSFVPVSPLGDTGVDELHPDMAKQASWGDDGLAGVRNGARSRFAVDGGVLANTPTQDALRAIEELPAALPVHRVMLLIYPHAPAEIEDRPDHRDTPPAVTGVLGGLLGALSSQGSRTFVDEVEAHNRAAASRRGTRSDILRNASGCEDIRRLAEVVYEHYRSLRIRRAARDLAARYDAPTDWSYERIRAAAETAQQDWADRHGGALPYVPFSAPGDRESVGPFWRWGITVAVDVGDAALDLLKRVAWTCPANGTGKSDENQIQVARKLVHQAKQELRNARALIDDRWNQRPLADLEPDTDYWRLRLAYYAAVVVGDTTELQSAIAAVKSNVSNQETIDAVLALAEVPPENPGANAAAAVDQIVNAVKTVLPMLKRALADPARADLGELKPWRHLLQPGGGTILSRLLWLHIAAWTIGDEVGDGSRFPVDLVQVSLQTPNAFTKLTASADDKVGGLSLNRFGGFLKQSWRMNDWTWGRVDAATMLLRVLLNPQRVRRYAVLTNRCEPDEEQARHAAEQFVDELTGLAFQVLPAHMVEAREDAVEELTPLFLTGPIRNMPASLPRTADLVAWAQHILIALEELPVIVRAVQADGQDRANPRSRGELFIRQYATLLATLNQADRPMLPLTDDDTSRGCQALDAFDRAGIGREDLAQEASSDQIIRTAATAAAVAATVADSPQSGLRAVKPITKTLRGAMLLPYWTITGLTAGTAIVKSLALLGLAGGGLLLALSLLGALDSFAAPAAAIGASALLVTFGYAALRTGSLLHSIVLLAPVVPLISLAIVRAREDATAEGGGKALITVAVIAAVSAGLMLLGSISAPVKSPPATMRALRRDKWWKWTTLFWLVGVIVMAALTVAVVANDWWDELTTAFQTSLVYLRDHRLLVVAVAVALAVVSYLLCRWAARSFRLIVRSPDSKTWLEDPVEHPAGVTASWSCVYGLAFLVATVVQILLLPDPISGAGLARRVALLTTAIFAVGLLFAVPLTTAVLGRRRTISDFASTTSTADLPAGEEWTKNGAQRLADHGRSLRFLVKVDSEGTLHLQPAGEKLFRHAATLDGSRRNSMPPRTLETTQGSQ